MRTTQGCTAQHLTFDAQSAGPRDREQIDHDENQYAKVDGCNQIFDGWKRDNKRGQKCQRKQ